MKVEPRGKFGGVKVHLEPEDATLLIAHASWNSSPLHPVSVDVASLINKMGKAIQKLQDENPNLLQDRTKEEVIAILAKEAEKAKLQLEQAKKGGDFSKVDPAKLKEAMLKHVNKEKSK